MKDHKSQSSKSEKGMIPQENAYLCMDGKQMRDNAEYIDNASSPTNQTKDPEYALPTKQTTNNTHDSTRNHTNSLKDIYDEIGQTYNQVNDNTTDPVYENRPKEAEKSKQETPNHYMCMGKKSANPHVTNKNDVGKPGEKGQKVQLAQGNDPKGVYLTTPNEEGVYLNPSNEEGVYLTTPNEEGVYLTTPNEEGVYLTTPNEEGVYLTTQNEEAAQLTTSNEGVIMHPEREKYSKKGGIVRYTREPTVRSSADSNKSTSNPKKQGKQENGYLDLIDPETFEEIERQRLSQQCEKPIAAGGATNKVNNDPEIKENFMNREFQNKNQATSRENATKSTTMENEYLVPFNKRKNRKSELPDGLEGTYALLDDPQLEQGGVLPKEKISQYKRLLNPFLDTEEKIYFSKTCLLLCCGILLILVLLLAIMMLSLWSTGALCRLETGVLFLANDTQVHTDSRRPGNLACDPKAYHGIANIDHEELILSGNSALYICPNGHAAINNQPYHHGQTRCVNGQWKPSPECISLVSSTQRPTTATMALPCQVIYTDTLEYDGIADGGSVRSDPNRRISYTCAEGYEPASSEPSTVCINGTWTPLPVCIEMEYSYSTY